MEIKIRTGTVIITFNMTCLRKSPLPSKTSTNGTKFMGVYGWFKTDGIEVITGIKVSIAQRINIRT